MLTITQCFKYIVSSPPPPLSEEDILFQIGHVHEQQKDVSFPPGFTLALCSPL
jgi:hypothetical protein